MISITRSRGEALEYYAQPANARAGFSGISRIRFVHSSNQIPCSSNVCVCVLFSVVWRFFESRDVQSSLP